MNCSRMVFSQEISVKPVIVELLNLLHTKVVHFMKRHFFYGFYMVKYSKFDGHF